MTETQTVKTLTSDTAVEILAIELTRHVAGMGALPAQRGTDEQRGGLRCLCDKWSQPVKRVGTVRPWLAYHRHVAEALVNALENEAKK